MPEFTREDYSQEKFFSDDKIIFVSTEYCQYGKHITTRSQIKNHESFSKRLRKEVIERRLNNTFSRLNDTSTMNTKIKLQYHFKQMKLEALPREKRFL